MRSTLLRRDALVACLAAACLPPPRAAIAGSTASTKVTWGPLSGLSDEQLEALDDMSRDPTSGVTDAKSGMRVIDLVKGDGPLPAAGDRIYVHYKIWSEGFRVGKAADFSFVENRPFDYILGEPTKRLPGPIDAGIMGMREGGWRRIYAPDAFGDVGLRKQSFGPQGRYTGAKAPLLIQPHAPAYVDIIMLDGGSGRCERFLRPPGVSEKERAKLKSLTCSARMEIF